MYHEFMQLIEGAKGAFPAARNTNLPCIPATRFETKPWSLLDKESEAQLLASFTEYTERNDLQLLLWTSATRKEISLRQWEATIALAIGSRSHYVQTSLPTLASRCNVR